MNILIVNDYKDKIGGTEIYIWTLKNELEKSGYKIKIFGYSITKSQHKNQSNSLKKYINKFFNLSAYIEIRREIKSFKPDIIHLHNIFNELSPSILLATNNIPTIMTVHDNQLINPVSIQSSRTGKLCKKRTCGGCINCVGIKGALYENIKRAFHKVLLKKISLFITPSNYMKMLVEEAGFKPVIHIPNGFKLFKYSPITQFNKLLYVGRISTDKGVEYLLRAMPIIINKIPKISLTIIGNGPNKDVIQKLAKKLNIISNIKFKEKIPHEKLERYYRNSTVVIVPSIYNDNFPTVCIESMSVGRPIIGSSIGGIPEIITNRKTGFLIKTKSETLLAKTTIKLLLNRKLINIMSRNALNKSKSFLLNDHINKIKNVYLYTKQGNNLVK